jgi:uncharacterized protein (TIGR03083 family)
MVDVWPTVHAERRALARQLADLTDDAWDTPSLCEGWTVRDLVAHLTAAASITPLTFFPKVISAGFSLTRMQARDVARLRGANGAETLAGFQQIITSKRHPPGPNDTWLGEVLVHGEDIRRPLGLTYDYPLDAAAQVADSYAKSNLVIGAKRRIAGVSLRATDTSWSHGSGPAVEGPMMSLLLAMTGRRSALADLTGDGVATLSGR